MKINIDPRQLNADLQNLIKRIKKRLNLDKEETAVIAIGRGGLVPAQYLAYALDIEDIFCIQSTLYNDDDVKTDIHHISGVYSIPYNDYKYFLVVDDLIDSGTTMDNILEVLYDTSEHVLGEEFNDIDNFFIPAVIYTQKSKKEMKDQGIIYGRRVARVYQEITQTKTKEDPWVIFPWDELGG
jgi:hypoxanthine phosphoribosyltransferase